MSYTNFEATAAAFQAGSAHMEVANAARRLSKGDRIEKPHHDGGGLSMHARIGSANMRHRAAMQNLSNAISYSQKQVGYLQQAITLFQRMGELASYATDLTKSPADRENYDKEMQELAEEYQQYFVAEFNGRRIFDVTGACGEASIKVADQGSGTASEKVYEVETYTGAGTVKWDQFAFMIPDLFRVYHGDVLIHERVTGAAAFSTYVGGLKSGNPADVSRYAGDNYKPEPFSDFGEDGIAGTGDEGEGNGEFDWGEPFTNETPGSKDGGALANNSYDGYSETQQAWISAQGWTQDEAGNPSPGDLPGARSVFKFGPNGTDVNGNPYTTDSTKLRFVINEGGATVSDLDMSPNATEWEHSAEIIPESNDSEFVVVTDGFGTEVKLQNVSLAVFQGYDLKNLDNAQKSLAEIDHVIECLTTELAQAEANAQRLEKETLENQYRISATELAEGRIMDLDMAMEASAFAKSKIRYQGAISVMQKAQIIPQVILGLLTDGHLR